MPGLFLPGDDALHELCGKRCGTLGSKVEQTKNIHYSVRTDAILKFNLIRIARIQGCNFIEKLKPIKHGFALSHCAQSGDKHRW